MYYNTNNLKGVNLIEVWKNTDKQKDVVLQFFEINPEVNMTPSYIWGELINWNILDRVPLTSIRRAITDLTTDGKLEMLPLTVKGIYGAPEHYWTYGGPNQTTLAL